MSVAKVLQKFGGAHRPAEVFAAFVHLAACAVSCGRREAEYMEAIKRWSKEEANLFAEALAALVHEMETNPFRDCLGPTYMELLSSSQAQWGGEFHTPAEVCELMARVTLEGTPPPKEGLIRVCEPACGAGAQILAFAHVLGPQHLPRVRVHATDLNATACHMCFVNTTLWGIPAVIVHGNTLSQQVFNVWPNWPMLLYAPFSWKTCFRAEPTEPQAFEASYQQEPMPAASSTPEPDPLPARQAPPPAPVPILNLRTRKREENPAQLALF